MKVNHVPRIPHGFPTSFCMFAVFKAPPNNINIYISLSHIYLVSIGVCFFKSILEKFAF